jgi:hypothetical protein
VIGRAALVVVVCVGALAVSPSIARPLPVPQQGRLVPSDGADGDQFGFRVAVSGSTAVVGAAVHDGSRGAAYVFKRTGSGWAQSAELTASDAKPNDLFGASVAISGSTIVVGSEYANGGTGAAYVFTLSAGVWSQTAELTASDGVPGDAFGISTGISGTRVIVGADWASSNGAAYVFTKTVSGWQQTAKLMASDGASGVQFGFSVAISGTNAIVGAYDALSTGAAYVFTKASNGQWVQSAELTASDAAISDEFGLSVSISGTNAIVGAYAHAGDYTGAAYVFTKTTSGWKQAAELTAADAAPSHDFGFSVGISGTTAAVTAVNGSAYIFVDSSGSWVQSAQLSASDGPFFGYSVAVSGRTVVVGAPNGNSNIGSAYAYDVVAPPQEITASDGVSGDQFGQPVATNGSITVVGSYKHNSTTGAVYVFTKVSNVWVQSAELLASDGVAGDAFGRSVAISGSTVVVGAYGRNAFTGAAYVFKNTPSGWVQTAILTGSDSTDHNTFGQSVGISGSRIIVGADEADDLAGAAYVFTNSSTGWTQSAKLVASDGAGGELFGHAVGISGTTAVVGAYGNPYPTNRGAVYVYTKTGSAWPETAKLIASDATDSDGFGTSVAISGSDLIVGAVRSAFVPGKAYFFSRSLGTWTQDGEVTALDNTSGDYFGNSVSISGTTAAVGAPLHGLDVGTAYVFTKADTGWGQTAELRATNAAAYDDYGDSVAVYGTTAVVGADGHNVGVGSAFVYRL